VSVTRDELLAATAPVDLFGDAVGDRRALRRAYARLAKRYRPDDDPEAFQHLRGLYEQAQQRSEPFAAPAPPAAAAPAAPAAPAPDGPPPAPTATAAPRPLRQASRAEMAHPEFLARVARAIPVPPWGGDQEDLQALLDVLDSVPPDIPLDPDGLGQLEDRLLDGLAGHAALADPDVPDALVAVAGCTGDRLALLRAFEALGAAVSYDDLRGALDHVELHYPALWARYAMAHDRLVDDREVRQGWMDRQHMDDNDAPIMHLDVPTARLGVWPRNLFGVVVMATLRLMGLPFGAGAIGFAVAVVAWEATTLVHRYLRGVNGEWDAVARAQAVALMAGGHWPHEILDQVLRHTQLAPDKRVFSEVSCLLGLDIDRAFLPHALGPAHAERLEAECTR